MPFLIETNSGKIAEVVLGATPENGGTRKNTVTVGGASTLPFQNYEGTGANSPIIAYEVLDSKPLWNEDLIKVWGDVLESPVTWAKKAEELGADIIYLKLESIDPDHGGKTIDECIEIVDQVLKAVGCPIAVQGSGIDEYDKPLITAIAEKFKGENILFGLATQDNYATYVAACMANGHTLIAMSPLDINICKQLNIMITEMNMPLNRLIIDPSIGGLGYGLEYSYSVMERGRLGALQGDKMLSVPVIGFIGVEAWKAKEANASEEEFTGWGDKDTRGILWETITATSLLQAGIDILVMRHPEAMKVVKEQINNLIENVEQ